MLICSTWELDWCESQPPPTDGRPDLLHYIATYLIYETEEKLPSKALAIHV